MASIGQRGQGRCSACLLILLDCILLLSNNARPRRRPFREWSRQPGRLRDFLQAVSFSVDANLTPIELARVGLSGVLASAIETASSHSQLKLIVHYGRNAVALSWVFLKERVDRIISSRIFSAISAIGPPAFAI